MSDIPQWAIERVHELSASGITDAFARYIAEHEQPPIDPFVACIKLILGGFEGERHAQEYASKLRAELAKRGLEIRPVQS